MLAFCMSLNKLNENFWPQSQFASVNCFTSILWKMMLSAYSKFQPKYTSLNVTIQWPWITIRVRTNRLVVLNFFQLSKFSNFFHFNYSRCFTTLKISVRWTKFKATRSSSAENHFQIKCVYEKGGLFFPWLNLFFTFIICLEHWTQNLNHIILHRRNCDPKKTRVKYVFRVR